MINDDVIVKYARTRMAGGHTLWFESGNWPDYVRMLKQQILEVKLGFPGIGDEDLSLIGCGQAAVGKRVILSDNLDANCGSTDTDHAPILGLILGIDSEGYGLIEIEGIGSGLDFTRDPDRLLRWGQQHAIQLLDYQTILEVTSKPRPDGGSVYYYFNKHPRDARW